MNINNIESKFRNINNNNNNNNKKELKELKSIIEFTFSNQTLDLNNEDEDNIFAKSQIKYRKKSKLKSNITDLYLSGNSSKNDNNNNNNTNDDYNMNEIIINKAYVPMILEPQSEIEVMNISTRRFEEKRNIKPIKNKHRNYTKELNNTNNNNITTNSKNNNTNTNTNTNTKITKTQNSSALINNNNNNNNQRPLLLINNRIENFYESIYNKTIKNINEINNNNNSNNNSNNINLNLNLRANNNIQIEQLKLIPHINSMKNNLNNRIFPMNTKSVDMSKLSYKCAEIGCEWCDKNNLKNCIQCKGSFFLHYNKCYAMCPSNLVADIYTRSCKTLDKTSKKNYKKKFIKKKFLKKIRRIFPNRLC